MNNKDILVTPANIQGELIRNEIELNDLQFQAFKEQKYNELLKENQQLKERYLLLENKCIQQKSVIEELNELLSDEFIEVLDKETIIQILDKEKVGEINE